MKSAYRNWIAQRLIELRNSRNMTQQNAALILGLKLGRYQSYEEERAQPPIPVVIKIAKYYGLSLDQFFEGCPEEQQAV